MTSNAGISLPCPLTAFIINLDRDTERWAAAEQAFGALSCLRLQRIPGVPAACLPAVAAEQLARDARWAQTQRGALGCFLAHAAAWEAAVASESPWVLVLEDDAVPHGLDLLFAAELPEDAELVWISSRANPRGRNGAAAVPRFLPLRETLSARLHLLPGPAALGAYAYLLSAEGARKLLAAVARDGFGSHADWRLPRYATREEEREDYAAAPWYRHHFGLHAGRPFAWGVVRAYVSLPHLVRLRGGPSSRKQENAAAPAAPNAAG